MLVVVGDRVLVILDHPRFVDPRVFFRFHLDALFVLVDEHVALLRLELRALLMRSEAHVGPDASGDPAVLVLAQDRGRRAGALLLLLLTLLRLLLLSLHHALALHVRLLALFLCEPGLLRVFGHRLPRPALLVGLAVLARIVGVIGRRVVIALGIVRDGRLPQVAARAG